MDADYWLQRWKEGRTGWHHESVMPLLEQHWPSLRVESGTRVLVPLCGNRWTCFGSRGKECVCWGSRFRRLR